MSKLLLDSHPLVVLPELAVLIGLNEAIVLQQVHYWLVLKEKADQSKTQMVCGRYWVYNTYQEWQKQFPWWSEKTVQRIVTNLEKMGLVLSKRMNKKKYDNTKWYSIEYENLEKMIGKMAESIGAVHEVNLTSSMRSICSEQAGHNDLAYTRDYYKEKDLKQQQKEVVEGIKKSEIQQLAKEILKVEISNSTIEKIGIYDIAYVREKMEIAAGKEIQNIDGWLIRACVDDYKLKKNLTREKLDRLDAEERDKKYKDIYIS